MKKIRQFPVAFLSLAAAVGVSPSAWAGTFSMAQFVSPGEFAIGIEPEITLTDGAGLATNVKFTQGVTDLNNFIATIGTGSGSRAFRVGGGMTFDFFPDLEGQPGIGIATQGTYYRLAGTGQLELQAVPYIHKTFRSGDNEIQPFFAFPLGYGFSEGNYRPITSAAIGSIFRSSEHFRYVTEFGIAVNNTETYVSGGIVYYH